MKLTRQQAESIVQILKEVLINNRYADKAVERIFKESAKILPTDKGFIVDAGYDIIRYYRMLATVSQSKSLWKILGAWTVLRGYELSPWKEFSSISAETVKKNHQQILSDRKIRESIPDWLDELGSRELGNAWDDELASLNKAPKIYLRTNLLKITRDNLLTTLTSEGIGVKPEQEFPEAVLLIKKQNIFNSKAFQEGLFEVQDAGSQSIVPFLHVKPGMRVIDACAGTGGKSLHLASHMNNKGRLIALDISPWKLEELKSRARRAGVHNFETKLIDSQKVIKRHQKTADRLLLDVPCSGLGVLKRNPDAKWKLKPDFITNLLDTQRHILSTYSDMVKVGGLLVYSTCSILPSENENQVKSFL